MSEIKRRSVSIPRGRSTSTAKTFWELQKIADGKKGSLNKTYKCQTDSRTDKVQGPEPKDGEGPGDVGAAVHET